MKKRRKRKGYGRWFAKTMQRECYYCGVRFTKEGRHRRTADHVKPLSQGGYDKRKNVVACCYACNQAKGRMSVDEFRNRLQECMSL